MIKRLIKDSLFCPLLLFIIAEILINPIGNFPLNDDWAYGKEILNLIKKGELKFLDWHTITGVVPVISGAAFCKLFGFSFTVLRLLNLGLIIGSAYIFDHIQKRWLIPPGIRILSDLLFLFNPLTLCLGNTFLPDVFVLFFALLSFFSIIEFIENERFLFYILIIMSTLLATLCRQTGVLIPVAFAIAWIYKKGISFKNISKAILPLIFNLSVLTAFQSIARKSGILGNMYNYQMSIVLNNLLNPSMDVLRRLLYYSVTSSVSLGLFVLPFSISMLKEFKSELKKRIWPSLIFFLYLLIIALKIILSEKYFPFAGNIIHPDGLGPVIMRGYNTQDPTIFPTACKFFLIALTLTGAVSFWISLGFFYKIFKNNSSPDIKCGILFITVLSLLYLTPICLNYANDRYLLFLVPLFLLPFALVSGKIFGNFLFVFIPFFLFSLSATHDYLALNRARWKASEYLTNKMHISPDIIDGGFEFNGWYTYKKGNYDPAHKGNWWWVIKDEYIISPEKIKGYYSLKEFSYNRWMKPGCNIMYVLKKKF